MKKEDITIRLTKTTILTFPQTQTLKSVLILEKDYQVDFNHQNSLSKVLGFTERISRVGKCGQYSQYKQYTP